jgi:hypothetical protein
MMKTAFLACTLLLTTVSTAMADIKSKVIREASSCWMMPAKTRLS